MPERYKLGTRPGNKRGEDIQDANYLLDEGMKLPREIYRRCHQVKEGRGIKHHSGPSHRIE